MSAFLVLFVPFSICCVFLVIFILICKHTRWFYSFKISETIKLCLNPKHHKWPFLRTSSCRDIRRSSLAPQVEDSKVSGLLANPTLAQQVSTLYFPLTTLRMPCWQVKTSMVSQLQVSLGAVRLPGIVLYFGGSRYCSVLVWFQVLYCIVKVPGALLYCGISSSVLHCARPCIVLNYWCPGHWILHLLVLGHHCNQPEWIRFNMNLKKMLLEQWWEW